MFWPFARNSTPLVTNLTVLPIFTSLICKIAFLFYVWALHISNCIAAKAKLYPSLTLEAKRVFYNGQQPLFLSLVVIRTDSEGFPWNSERLKGFPFFSLCSNCWLIRLSMRGEKRLPPSLNELIIFFLNNDLRVADAERTRPFGMPLFLGVGGQENGDIASKPPSPQPHKTRVNKKRWVGDNLVFCAWVQSLF